MYQSMCTESLLNNEPFLYNHGKRVDLSENNCSTTHSQPYELKSHTRKQDGHINKFVDETSKVTTKAMIRKQNQTLKIKKSRLHKQLQNEKILNNYFEWRKCEETTSHHINTYKEITTFKILKEGEQTPPSYQRCMQSETSTPPCVIKSSVKFTEVVVDQYNTNDHSMSRSSIHQTTGQIHCVQNEASNNIQQVALELLLLLISINNSQPMF